VNNINKANKTNATYLFLDVGLFLLSPLAIEPGVAPECVTILLVIQNDKKIHHLIICLMFALPREL
jgi:hypothetical protein